MVRKYGRIRSMTFIVPISSKGQFTIPSEIRQALNLEKGVRLHLSFHKDTMTLRPAIQSNIEDFFGTIHESSNVPTKALIHKTLDGVMQAKFSNIKK
ncbi:MAG TPA: hypothetical protein DCX25_01820 [Candidatus Pacebacteria bacterium]|nr:hypothetical protein [Candidatus Paceibacterota bacterium]HCR11700.1 hypothetical protein [Candidatus Paceibacterota bacterium]HCR92483.1 hypothetical protein [Candidatus Paceibacterota bacterium]